VAAAVAGRSAGKQAQGCTKEGVVLTPSFG